MGDVIPKRGEWKSRAGFLLAAIGSAVGLGNIWRFPYVAYKNGGGAFLLPYLCALFMVGIPLLILEQGVGNVFKGSAPLAYARIRKRFEFLGWWVSVFIMFGLVLYYNAVLSWCVNYLAHAVNESWGSDTQSFFFNTFLGVTRGPFEIGGFRLPILAGLAFIWGVNWLIIHREVRKGIETATKICMPLLFVLLLILLIWSAMLPGAEDGVVAFITPDVNRLFDPAVWSDAFGQIFFTLSLGSGCMVVYASYLPSKAAISDNAVITAGTNSVIEIISGFAVFSIIGYMAANLGEPVASAVTSGPGLAFVTYPHAINLLPFGRSAFGILFFSALVLAGITSSIGMIEPFVSAMIDKFGWSRKRISSIACAIGFIGSLIFATRAGLMWLDIIDHFVCNVGMILVGLLEAILVGWLFGSKGFISKVEANSRIRLGKFWRFSIVAFVPIVLGGLFIADTVRSVENPHGGYSWLAIGVIGIGWLIATLVLAMIFTRARWKTKLLQTG